MTYQNDATIKTLNSLGAIFNFIDIWLKLLRENYCAGRESYINAMEELFHSIDNQLQPGNGV